MRHKVAGYKLGRSMAQRNALRRSLVTELIDHGRIQTTETKCKAIRDQAEKLVTIAKNSLDGDTAKQVSARRLVAAQVDGGVDPQTGAEVVAAGATVLVAGSSVFNHDSGVAAGVTALRRALGL